MVKRKTSIVLLCSALLVALACNPLSSVVGGEAGTVANLWSDVPSYPGAQKTNLEMPLVIRLAVEAASKAIMTEAGDKAGNLEFIAFDTSDSAQDVMAFYTVDRMEGEGWIVKSGDQPGCTTGDVQSQDIGAMCIFGKDGDPQSSALFIVIAADSQSHKTNLFYVRIDANADAVATAAAK